MVRGTAGREVGSDSVTVVTEPASEPATGSDAATLRGAAAGSVPDAATRSEADRPPDAGTGGMPPSRRRHVLRRVGAWILVAVVFLVTPVTAVTLYTRSQVLDTDHYVETVAPLASDPAVRAYVTDRLTREIFARLDVERRARRLLPGPADVLAGPLRGAAEARVRVAVDSALRTDVFARLWAEANRAAHAELRHLLTGEGSGALAGRADGAISVDLSEALPQLRTRLEAAGIPLPPGFPLAVGGRITIYHFEDLYRARRVVRALNRAAYVFPVVLALAAAGAILLFPVRRRGALAVAVAVNAGMGVVGVGLAVGRDVYLDRSTAKGMPLDAAASLYDTLARSLVGAVRLTLAVGTAVAVLLALLAVWERSRRGRGLRSGAA